MATNKSMSDLSAFQTSGAQVMMTLTETAIGFAAKLNALGLETAFSIIKVAAGNVPAVYGEGVQKLTLAPSLDASVVEQGTTYMRHVGEVSTRSQVEMTELVESYLSEVLHLFTSTLDKVAEAAPAVPTTATVAVMKSAVAATGAASIEAIRNARQVTPMILNALAVSDQANPAGSSKGRDKPARKAA